MILELRAPAHFDQPISLADVLVYFGARLKHAHTALNDLKATGRARVTITPDNVSVATGEIEALGCKVHARHIGAQA